jgi:pimeloyl-ACP methyl ester carboxylesterase
MTDYVLVHGAWDSARRYEQLAGDLTAAGPRVCVVHLAGLGTRKAELHGGITLTNHADDVEAAIDEAGFDRFVLVGHSYGGMVITMVATRLGARIDTMVYLDAFLPQDGQSLWDITGDYEHAHYIDSQKGRRIYVLATGWQPSPFPKFGARVKADPAWEYHEADTSHYVMKDAPEQVLQILLGAA